ncbi:UNVERIFIED_CONTAM: hypothetical protein Sangu_1845500 [Sesamum angustifolium]|uniref:Seed maturation protein n=1 Tax=Sesamum angustifolium TaxID=2727405 RepID=A0AAW2M8E6_9LAMI
MHSAKQKVNDAAAVVKEHAEILQAKAQEKAEKSVARTKEEKEIAHERRKVKEAEAKMKMHAAKAQHIEDKLLHGTHHALHHQPVAGTAVPPTGVNAPTYPLGGYPPGWTAPK